ncbi:unnamed protein product [marine sediment metagenome]|uniref:Uncharacterized protein n=1 Tax=marine sediment metagenome TaxID=412755 RepID=X0XRK1_9ZZZZ
MGLDFEIFTALFDQSIVIESAASVSQKGTSSVDPGGVERRSFSEQNAIMGLGRDLGGLFYISSGGL